MGPGIRSEAELMIHPKCGASWEGYVIEEALQAAAPDEAYFWATHQGAELDLLMIKDGRMLGLECKRVDAPRLTASMRIALEDLKLDRLAVVYPGALRYSLADRVEAVPLTALTQGPAELLWYQVRYSSRPSPTAIRRFIDDGGGAQSGLSASVDLQVFGFIIMSPTSRRQRPGRDQRGRGSGRIREIRAGVDGTSTKIISALALLAILAPMIFTPKMTAAPTTPAAMHKFSINVWFAAAVVCAAVRLPWAIWRLVSAVWKLVPAVTTLASAVTTLALAARSAACPAPGTAAVAVASTSAASAAASSALATATSPLAAVTLPSAAVTSPLAVPTAFLSTTPSLASVLM